MTGGKVKTDPKAWLRVLNEMLESREFDFASEYLTDVRDQVEDTGRITTGQTKAILNIRRSAL